MTNRRFMVMDDDPEPIFSMISHWLKSFAGVLKYQVFSKLRHYRSSILRQNVCGF